MGNITNTYYGDISLAGTTWQKKRSFYPTRCIFTGVWMKPQLLMRGARNISWHHQYYWTTSEELIMQKLKSNV